MQPDTPDDLDQIAHKLESDLLLACIDAAKNNPDIAPADAVKEGTSLYTKLMAGMFPPE